MLTVPSDWPADGAIDLALHDRPHASATTEWWYVNAHLKTAAGRELSLFAAFFRIRNGQDETGAPRFAHSATWALSDPDSKLYLSDSRVDPSAPRMGLERIRAGRGSRDPRLNRAISELLEKGRIPAPDRPFAREVVVAQDGLRLDFGGLIFEKLPGGVYRLELRDHHQRFGCELLLQPSKPAIRHGDDGVVRGPSGERMFYYFVPRCGVSGSILLGGAQEPIASGSGWYDHEFGSHVALPVKQEAPADIAWNWVAAQLDDGSELTAYALVRVEDAKVLHQWAICIDREGRRTAHTELQLTPLKSWRSIRTFYDYPTQWTLEVPGAQLSLSIDASFEDQEFITLISKPAFWEGRCQVQGTRRGERVAGLAYVERSGFEPIKDLDQFFSAVGEEVRKAVARTLPLEPSHAEAQELIASEARPQYMDGVELSQLSRALLQPVREITDRGGKSWRSYAALACCDVVQGDSRKFIQWLAMPELLHVGSLIVDDVQDKSLVRRGGPACHVVHGEPLAINAGTAAYFLTQQLLIKGDVSAERKLRLYDLYFEAMRAGHAGQALDLDGLASSMPEVVESGDGARLEKRILATHRLKTAAPAAALARMGAVAGGGSEAQIEAVGGFFEALGLAFQIVDDVLNLRAL